MVEGDLTFGDYSVIVTLEEKGGFDDVYLLTCERFNQSLVKMEARIYHFAPLEKKQAFIDRCAQELIAHVSK